MKNNKTVKAAAVVIAALILAGGALTARMLKERRDTEAADAAQRARWEQSGGTSDAADAADSAEAAAGGRREIDYAQFATNDFSEEIALSRPQLFQHKKILYNGKHYVRHTGIRAILFLGLDRTADDLQEQRLRWDQGQTDAIYLLAHNTARNTVKILKIPRDTMSVMPFLNEDYKGDATGLTILQLTAAFARGDGVELSCQRTMEATSRMLGGIGIDHYLLGDINVISELNDLIGGVTVKVPARMEEFDPEFKEGAVITLHGKQAERFVRRRDLHRYYTALERLERQQIFIIAFEKQLKKCLKQETNIVDRMFDTIESDMLSDMKRSEYVDLTLSILNCPDLTDNDFVMLPGQPHHGEVYSEYLPKYADINQVILDMFYYESQE